RRRSVSTTVTAASCSTCCGSSPAPAAQADRIAGPRRTRWGGHVRLVIFDLDGTITRHDTLAPYALGFVLRKRPWRLPALLLLLPVLLGYTVGLIDRGGLKSAFIRAALGGCHRKDLERWTTTFVERLMARGVFPQAIAAVEAHARAG